MRTILFSVLLTLFPSASFADDATSHSVSLKMGELAKLALDTNHLIYTSVVRKDDTRSIEVWIESGAVPEGTTLFLKADDFGLGEGFSAGEIGLSHTSQTLIFGIKSCATGEATGPTLTYRWDVGESDTENSLEIVVGFQLSGDVKHHQAVSLYPE